MPASQLTISFKQGTNWSRSWDLTAVDDSTINLSVFTGRMQGRASADSPTALFTLTTENGGLVLAGNRLTINFLPADTDDLDLREIIFDLIVTSSTGVKTDLLDGVLKLKRSITHAS